MREQRENWARLQNKTEEGEKRKGREGGRATERALKLYATRMLTGAAPNKLRSDADPLFTLADFTSLRVNTGFTSSQSVVRVRRRANRRRQTPSCSFHTGAASVRPSAVSRIVERAAAALKKRSS